MTSLVASSAKRRLEDRAEFQKLLEARRLANILACPQPFGIRHILLCIGRTEDDDRDFTALGTLPHAFQHVLYRSFRQVQVDDGKVRTIELIGLNRFDKRDGGFAINNVRHLAFDPVFFERLADKSRIGGIILDDKYRNRLLSRSPVARLRDRGL